MSWKFLLGPCAQRKVASGEIYSKITQNVSENSVWNYNEIEMHMKTQRNVKHENNFKTFSL